MKVEIKIKERVIRDKDYEVKDFCCDTMKESFNKINMEKYRLEKNYIGVGDSIESFFHPDKDGFITIPIWEFESNITGYEVGNFHLMNYCPFCGKKIEYEEKVVRE